MAIVKHIKSRNANYSAAINYLLFEHDEKTGKKIVDESGRSILRKEFYMDGLNCDPMSFDKECELTNAHFHKNKKHEDIKSSLHYQLRSSRCYRKRSYRKESTGNQFGTCKADVSRISGTGSYSHRWPQ